MSKFKPLHLKTMQHPLGPDLRTVAVPMVLEVRPVKGSAELDGHPIWAGAELTAFGRALPRRRAFKAREIRQPGHEEASALIVAFGPSGSEEEPDREVLPGTQIWEGPMAFILRPGRLVATWQGGIEPATQSYVDHLVSPAEYGPSRKLKPLTGEELQAFRDRAAAAGMVA